MENLLRIFKIRQLSEIIIFHLTMRKKIKNLEELDRELEYAESQFKLSDDYGRAALNSFYYKISRDSIPKDPFSGEYHDFQMRLYSFFSGHQKYSIANEATVFEGNEIKECPFPYYTHSASTVGDQLIAVGFIIKKMELAPHSNIIEFGPGWGNLTLALAQMGHTITCVEVEQRFIDLIKYRTRDLPGTINFFLQDMVEFTETSKETSENNYDAAIFFESFHHCRDPFTLLKNLSEIINEDGVICFASEPVVHWPSFAVPYPWGIRLDGLSLWSIRRSGWMELGFQTGFFKKLLSRYGFEITHVSSDVSPLANLIIAKKIKR
jgi:2-polyprenyl-3-methyl-5-hydroxy-6-metoxy-1,4-benzoquinol methylase